MLDMLWFAVDADFSAIDAICHMMVLLFISLAAVSGEFRCSPSNRNSHIIISSVLWRLLWPLLLLLLSWCMCSMLPDYSCELVALLHVALPPCTLPCNVTSPPCTLLTFSNIPFRRALLVCMYVIFSLYSSLPRCRRWSYDTEVGRSLTAHFLAMFAFKRTSEWVLWEVWCHYCLCYVDLI